MIKNSIINVWGQDGNATYTEKTKAENVYVTLKLEMFTFSVRNAGCKRKKNKLKSISVFTEARSESQGHKILCGSGKLINAYKLSKQYIHVINDVKENKLKSTSVRVYWSEVKVKVKVTKFFVGRVDIINAYKPTK